MKIRILSLLALAVAVASCNNSSNNTDPAKPSAAMSEPACYRFAADRDTVLLTFSTNDDVVSGTLVYNLYQKDKNTGTINGKIKGDLLVADYVFMSEGVSSVREVAFKKLGTDWIEGFGNTEEKNGKVVFTNTDSLEFEPKLPLKKIDCGK